MPLGVATALPAQGSFVEQTVASQLDSPVTMAVAPDGRVFIAQQGGDLRVVAHGALLPTPFVSVPTVANDEEGLIGVALDPAFASNHYVYTLFTAQTPTRHDQIVRYTAAGNVAATGSATVLFDFNDNSAHYHLGGSMVFGNDGRLYIGRGDNGNRLLGSDMTTTFGKVLRLAADGTIPTDNFFYGTASGICRAIHARGFRNAFSLAVQPTTGRIFVADIGANTWEEVDDLQAGGDYGWPSQEGPGGAPTYIDPVHSYMHTSGCAVIGGAFYNPALAQLPAQYVGQYIYADYCLNELRTIDPGNPAAYTVLRPTLAAGPVAVRVAPDGALYYLTRGNSDLSGGTNMPTGDLVRVSYTPNGYPSTFTTFGSGCAGHLGVPTLTMPALPSIDSPGLQVVVGNTNANMLTGLMLGVSNQVSGIGLLPIDLAFFGMPGCRLLTSTDATLIQVAAGNTASFSLPIRYDVALVGLHFYLQAVVSDPPANLIGLVTSSGGDLGIGL